MYGFSKCRNMCGPNTLQRNKDGTNEQKVQQVHGIGHRIAYIR